MMSEPLLVVPVVTMGGDGYGCVLQSGSDDVDIVGNVFEHTRDVPDTF